MKKIVIDGVDCELDVDKAVLAGILRKIPKDRLVSVQEDVSVGDTLMWVDPVPGQKVILLCKSFSDERARCVVISSEFDGCPVGSLFTVVTPDEGVFVWRTDRWVNKIECKS